MPLVHVLLLFWRLCLSALNVHWPHTLSGERGGIFANASCTQFSESLLKVQLVVRHGFYIAELTFAPAAFGDALRGLSPQSEASSSPASSPTVAGKAHDVRQHAGDQEAPFQLHVRAPSQRNDRTSDSSSGQCEPTAYASSTPCHSNSVYPSITTGPGRESSPDRTSRASSARSASLNPAAASSWRDNTEDKESLTSRSQSPELSARTPSICTPERSARDGDLSFLSPMSASDLGESASVTATPTDLVADVDSILCTSFWAS